MEMYLKIILVTGGRAESGGLHESAGGGGAEADGAGGAAQAGALPPRHAQTHAAPALCQSVYAIHCLV